MAGRGKMWKIHVSVSKIWRKKCFRVQNVEKLCFRVQNVEKPCFVVHIGFFFFFKFWRADWPQMIDSTNQRSPFSRPTGFLKPAVSPSAHWNSCGPTERTRRRGQKGRSLEFPVPHPDLIKLSLLGCDGNEASFKSVKRFLTTHIYCCSHEGVVF